MSKQKLITYIRNNNIQKILEILKNIFSEKLCATPNSGASPNFIYNINTLPIEWFDIASLYSDIKSLIKSHQYDKNTQQQIKNSIGLNTISLLSFYISLSEKNKKYFLSLKNTDGFDFLSYMGQLNGFWEHYLSHLTMEDSVTVLNESYKLGATSDAHSINIIAYLRDRYDKNHQSNSCKIFLQQLKNTSTMYTIPSVKLVIDKMLEAKNENS